ncbi:MAG: hypothetical protein ABIO86_01165 [Sphingomonas sp.]
MARHYWRSSSPVLTAALLCMGGALLALVASPLQASRSSTRAITKMSPGEANQQARDDLLSILEPTGKIGSGMWLELHDVALNTRSFGTDFEGVCRRDTLTVRYTGAAPGPPSRDKPIRPYSIEAHPTFHIVHLPEIGTAMGQPDPSHIAQPACVDVDKAWLKQARAEGRELDEWNRATWVEAKDAFQAVQAGFMLEMALAAARAHTLKPEPCDILLPEQRSCEQVLGALGGVSDMASVTPCLAQTGLICYEIGFRNATELTIVARGKADDLVPAAIQSIGLVENITVT